MARKLAAVVFSLGCLQASSVMALGLGELKLESFLNEPLKASVDLLNTGGLHEEEIKIRLATREDFDKLGLERAYFLTNITFSYSDCKLSRSRRTLLASRRWCSRFNRIESRFSSRVFAIRRSPPAIAPDRTRRPGIPAVLFGYRPDAT